MLTAQQAVFVLYVLHRYVIKHGVFARSEMQPVIKAVEGLVDSLATKLARAGKIADVGAGLPFETRLMHLESQFAGASVLLHKNGVLPRGIADLWCHPRLLSVCAAIGCCCAH